MLNIFLNIIGLIFIIISIILIKKTSDKELAVYEEILIIEDNIKSYSAMMENVLNNFDKLMDSSLDKLQSMEEQNISNKNVRTPKYESLDSKDSYLMKNKILAQVETESIDTNNIYNEIVKLAKIGLNTEEIAKKLNIGIREVEVFLKIWHN